MTMDETTPRFALPFLVPGQAQKELLHNEALLRIDAALQAAVEGGPRADPPADPAEGACWIVAGPAAGAWAGRETELAMWSAGGWRFVAPAVGMSVWNKADRRALRWSGSGWSDGELHAAALFVDGLKVVGQRAPAVPSPSGGTIIDAEARAAVNSLIATLMSHGLID
jgi:hypothetical protein